jgi:hypothetical protein
LIRCNELNVMISNVDVDESGYVTGNIERIGNNGNFKFEIYYSDFHIPGYYMSIDTGFSTMPGDPCHANYTVRISETENHQPLSQSCDIEKVLRSTATYSQDERQWFIDREPYDD